MQYSCQKSSNEFHMLSEYYTQFFQASFIKLMLYSVWLLLSGCAPALSFIMSVCRQQSVQLLDELVTVPLGSLLFSYMSSQAACFYTWHITMCWQINLWELNGTENNVTHNVKHTGKKSSSRKGSGNRICICFSGGDAQDLLYNQCICV